MKQLDTKTQILDAAQDLIQRLGVNSMSYQDISEVVGIRKASIHSHFPKKDDLLKVLLERYNDNFLRVVDSIIASDDSPEVKLRHYCGLFEATLCSGNQDKACLYSMVGAELETLNNPLVEIVRAFYRENESRLAIILEQGRQTSDFRFKGDSQASASLVFALLEGGMLIARAHGGVQGFHSMIEQLLQFVKG